MYSDNKNAVFVKDDDRNWESLLISKVLPAFHSLEITFHMVTLYVCIFAIKIKTDVLLRQKEKKLITRAGGRQ